jgi:hypothetical protein
MVMVIVRDSTPAVGGSEAKVPVLLLHLGRVAAQSVTRSLRQRVRVRTHELRRLRFATMNSGHMALLRAIAASKMLGSPCSAACSSG